MGCFLIALAVVGLLIAWGAFMSWASIQGTEFSPNSFQMRNFSYSRVPGTRLRLGATRLGAPWSVASTDVLKHLPIVTAPQQWHISRISNSQEPAFGAEILVEALQQRNADGNDFWGKWSFDNPKLAAILWPLVQQVAIHELYECIPEILEIAESSSDPASLEQQALDTVARSVIEYLERLEFSSDESRGAISTSWLESMSVTQRENASWWADLQQQLRNKIRSP